MNRPDYTVTRTSGDVLFNSKISLPHLRFQQVYRPRLAGAIAQTDSYQVLCVTAPAGCGKTTAVVQGVLQSGLPAAWFTVDHRDNGLIKFWKYMILALEQILPGLEQDFNRYLDSSYTMPVQAGIFSILDALQNHDQEFLIVLDDFGCLSNQEVIDSLVLFIEHLPANVHLILAGRKEADFLKKRMAITHEVVYIKTDQLDFTKAEIEEYCELQGITLAPSELETLLFCSEGWPVAVAMLLDARSATETPRSWKPDCTNLSEAIVEYFNEEIMSSLPEDEVEFMIKTSILSKLSAPICEALTGRLDSSLVLQQLHKKNFLMGPDGADQDQFRYQRLFRVYLQRLLNQRFGDTKNHLYGIAADWFETNGDLEKAFKYLKAMADEQRMAGFIQRNGRQALATGSTRLLASWLDCLPEASEASLQENYMLSLLRAWVFLLDKQYPAVQQLLAGVEAALTEPGEILSDDTKNKIRAEVLIIHGYMEFLKHNLEAAMELVIRAHRFNADSLLFNLGIDFMTGEIRLLGGIFGFYGALSKLNKPYLEKFEKVEQIWGRFGYRAVLLGELLYERNQVEEAYPYLLQGYKEAMSIKAGGSLASSVVAISRLRKAMGDVAGALNILEIGRQWLTAQGITSWDSSLAAWQGALTIGAGDFQAADAWIQTADLEIDGVLELSRVFEYMVLARIKLARQDLHSCDVLLSGLIVLLEGENRICSLIEAYNLKAVCSYLLKQEEKAQHYLGKSLELGQSEGYTRSFLEEGPVLTELLKKFSQRPVKSGDKQETKLIGYAKMLYQSTDGYSELDRRGDTPPELEHQEEAEAVLSRRELEILKLMGQGFSQKKLPNSAKSLSVQ